MIVSSIILFGVILCITLPLASYWDKWSNRKAPCLTQEYLQRVFVKQPCSSVPLCHSGRFASHPVALYFADGFHVSWLWNQSLTSLVNQKLLNVNPLWTDCRFALFSGPHFVWYRLCFSLDASIYVNSGLISTVYAFFSWFHMEQLALLFWMRPWILNMRLLHWSGGQYLQKSEVKKNGCFIAEILGSEVRIKMGRHSSNTCF